MKKFLLSSIVLTFFSLASINTTKGQSVIMFTDTFINGITPSPAQCSAWTAFRASLTPKCYTKLTIKGTFEAVGLTTSDPAIIAAYANALNTNVSYISPITNGNEWHYCTNTSTHVWVNPVGFCSGANCPNPGYIIRPCIGNSNWGGVKTATCNAPSQRMTLIFEYDSTLGVPGAIVGLDTLCHGDTVVYSMNSVPGAVSYTWTFPAGWLIQSGQGSNSVTAVSGVSGTISVKIKNACDSTTVVKPVYVGDYPIISLTDDTTICVNNNVQLLAGGGVYYSWTPTLGLSCNNCPNPLATPLTTTKYYVTVSDSLGCSSTDSVTITVDPCVGISEIGNSPALKLHPNPSTGKFKLQALNLPEENARITIFDIHGKAVYVQSLKTDEGKLLHNIQLENMPAGVYQVQIESGNVLKKEKLILQ